MAAGRAGRTPGQPVGGGAGGEQRSARSVHRPQPVVFLRRVARARADRSRQPAHPGRSRQMRGVRAAVHRRDEAVRAPRSAGGARHSGRAGARASRAAAATIRMRRRATASGRGRTSRIRPTRSACGRSRRTISSSSTRPARRASSARPISRAVHRRCIRRRSTSSRASCFRWRSSTSRGAKRSCARSTATTTRRRSPTRASRIIDTFARGRLGSRAALARRSPRRVAGRRVQEDQVLHQRERRIRRARSARAADAHDVVLDDDSGRRSWRCCRTRRRSARRRRGAVVRDEAGRAAAADVRRPRHRHLARHRSARARGCSSTTTIRAASVSASRCSACITSCSTRRGV